MDGEIRLTARSSIAPGAASLSSLHSSMPSETAEKRPSAVAIGRRWDRLSSSASLALMKSENALHSSSA